MRLSKKPRPPFIFVQASEDGRIVRTYNEPASSRELYRMLRREAMADKPQVKIDVFVYAGHRYTRCDECLGFTSVGDGCSFCGAELARAASE